MLPLLAVAWIQQIPDEVAFARAAVPIPEVAHDDGTPAWSIYTARTEPASVRATIDRAFEARRGWRRTSLGWSYDSFRLVPVYPSLRIDVEVLQGRAMPVKEAAPQTDVWTTVRLIRTGEAGSRGLPYRGWVLATRPEDDAALNVPVGEERSLPDLVGLPLASHETRFGAPRWVFEGDVSMGEAIKRVDRALAGRSGWRGLWPISIVGERGTHPTFWRFKPKGSSSGPPLSLFIENGRSLGDRDHRARRATVRVDAETPRLG